MRTMIIGIDPGLTGAVAVIDPDGMLTGVWDAPVLKGRTGKTDFLLGTMATLIRDLTDAAAEADLSVHVALERVGTRPGESASGAFKFGTGWGMWQGIAATLNLPLTLITPQTWQKFMLPGMNKGNKDVSRLRAMQLWPTRSEWFKLKKHDGRAEAAMIGAAVRLHLLGTKA